MFIATDETHQEVWYALYTRHQHEKSIEQVLRYKGFEVLLPLYQAVHRWKDRYKEVSVPLFPCYVFVKAVWQRRRDIVVTPGVHNFVTSRGEAIPMPEGDIEAIRRVLDVGVGVEPHPFLNCGDCVRVKSGPLEGIEGILVRKKNRLRLVLSITMLGKAASVEVDGFLVEKLRSTAGTAARQLSNAYMEYRPATA